MPGLFLFKMLVDWFVLCWGVVTSLHHVMFVNIIIIIIIIYIVIAIIFVIMFFDVFVVLFLFVSLLASFEDFQLSRSLLGRSFEALECQPLRPKTSQGGGCACFPSTLPKTSTPGRMFCERWGCWA